MRAEAVAAEREQAAGVLEAVGEGIFLVDGDGIVRLWNRAAVLGTGRQADDVRGRPIADVLPGWAAIAGQIPVAESGASAASVTLPLELDGAELWLSFVAVRSAEGVVYAFRDQTTERGLEEAKSEFIATVSHELRTPMAGIYGAAQTLLREDVEFSPEDRRRLLEIVATQAVRLSQITEDVLVASRLERDELRVAREQVDVGALASETIEAMRSQLPEVTTVELAVEPKLEPAFGDRDRLQQVLVNLLDNAVKYSPDGGQVTVSVESRPDAVRLSVTDQGLGIPLAEQERIFEKFYRLDTAADPCRRRNGARALHHPGARAPNGRHDRSPVGAGRGLDVHGGSRARGSRVGRVESRRAFRRARRSRRGHPRARRRRVRGDAGQVLQPDRRLLHLGAEEGGHDQADAVDVQLLGALPALREADRSCSDLQELPLRRRGDVWRSEVTWYKNFPPAARASSAPPGSTAVCGSGRR